MAGELIWSSENIVTFSATVVARRSEARNSSDARIGVATHVSQIYSGL